MDIYNFVAKFNSIKMQKKSKYKYNLRGYSLYKYQKIMFIFDRGILYFRYGDNTDFLNKTCMSLEEVAKELQLDYNKLMEAYIIKLHILEQKKIIELTDSLKNSELYKIIIQKYNFMKLKRKMNMTL